MTTTTSATTRHAALGLVAVVFLIAAYGSGLTPWRQVRHDPHARVVDKAALTVKESHHGATHALPHLYA